MSKVKVTVAQKTMKDKQLIEMFNQMVGTSAPDPNVVVPKYDKLMELSRETVGILQSFVSTAPPILRVEFPKGVEEIEQFIVKSTEDLKGLTLVEQTDSALAGEDLNSVNSNPELMNKFMENMGVKYNIEELGETYKNLKDSEFIKSVIMTYRQLKESLAAEAERRKIKMETLDTEHDLADKTKLKGGFIKKSLGDVLHLFSFSSLNFKELCMASFVGSPNAPKSMYSNILFMLYLIYNKCDQIYKLVSSPDIDVEKFSAALVGNIATIKKQIPRCDEAFNKIEESVNLLRDKFGGYYKDFITSQNPGIIVENFVLDVAKDSKANSKVTRQFKQIIGFYKKKMAGQIKDPKIKRIFDLVGANLNILEKKTAKRDGGGEDEDGDDDEEENSEDAEPAPFVEKTPEELEAVKASFLPEQMKQPKPKSKPKSAAQKSRKAKKRAARAARAAAELVADPTDDDAVIETMDE
jgi:hypothetical protein